MRAPREVALRPRRETMLKNFMMAFVWFFWWVLKEARVATVRKDLVLYNKSSIVGVLFELRNVWRDGLK